MIGFDIGISDFFDVLLTAFLFYWIFKILKQSGAVSVFIGIMTFVFVWFLVSRIFDMKLLGSIFNGIVNVGAFAMVVLFQDEIKRFFSRIGSRRNWGLLNYFKKFFNASAVEDGNTDYDIIQIVLACRNLARTVTGGLIVITRENDLEIFAQTGEDIDANIRSRLIENIFFTNSPLHDGALIINKRRLRAAACILPVSNNQSIPKYLGLRHRSALGISEQSDAIAIIVSEETGKISWAINGELKINVKPEELEHFLSKELKSEI